MAKISTLSGFMAWVKKRKDIADKGPEKTALLYRGHANKSWQLQPSVYRTDFNGKSYRQQEYYLYQEMLRRNPIVFERDGSVFEKLVRMQHNGLPTRLLDLTTSALVALYFACEGEGKSDGEVLLFTQIRSLVLFPHAIPEQSLSGLEKQLQLEQMGVIIRDWFLDFFNEEARKSCHVIPIDDEYQKIISEISRLLSINENGLNTTDLLCFVAIFQKVTHIVDEFSRKYQEDIFHQSVDLMNVSPSEVTLFLVRFQHGFYTQIKSIIKRLSDEIGISYAEQININNFISQFSMFHFVFPHLNNERIKRQQGLFLLYPPIESKFNDVSKCSPCDKVIINATAKKQIIKDLAAIGITRSYLYPELTEQAADLKKLYPAI